MSNLWLANPWIKLGLLGSVLGFLTTPTVFRYRSEEKAKKTRCSEQWSLVDKAREDGNRELIFSAYKRFNECYLAKEYRIKELL